MDSLVGGTFQHAAPTGKSFLLLFFKKEESFLLPPILARKRG
jgi:hypothetical protein